MKTALECIPCFARQATEAFTLLDAGAETRIDIDALLAQTSAVRTRPLQGEPSR